MGANGVQADSAGGVDARAGLAISTTGAGAVHRGPAGWAGASNQDIEDITRAGSRTATDEAPAPARHCNLSSIRLRTEAAMHHHEFISRAVSTDREITLEALRVFTYLSRRLHFDHSIPVLQSELADALGMQRPNVNRAIKLLETKQILLRESKLGRAITFRLNPELGSRAA